MGEDVLNSIAAEIAILVSDNNRVIVAVAGPPATGKSTFAEKLNDALNIVENISSALVPMDGFHLDNERLEEMELFHRKGAPETFDFDGFHFLISRLKSEQSPIYYPVFDRELDRAIAGKGVVSPHHNMVLVEGNYLLFDEKPWNTLSGKFDHTIYLDTPVEILKERLVQRWLDHGHTQEEALERAMSNDIPNAERICAKIVTADRVLKL